MSANKEMKDTVEITSENERICVDPTFFEHLLNCLANQKYIREQLPKTRKEWQAEIDKTWNKGMEILGDHRKPAYRRR